MPAASSVIDYDLIYAYLVRLPESVIGEKIDVSCTLIHAHHHVMRK